MGSQTTPLEEEQGSTWEAVVQLGNTGRPIVEALLK